MINTYSVTLEGHGIRLEPLAYEHQEGWLSRRSEAGSGSFGTTVPEPEETRS